MGEKGEGGKAVKGARHRGQGGNRGLGADGREYEAQRAAKGARGWPE